MLTCPSGHRPASKRDGHEAAGRQRAAWHACRRAVTARAAAACTGSRWPAAGILLAVRWSLRQPLSAPSDMAVRAERVVPGDDAPRAPVHERVRAVARAVTARGARLPKAVTPAA